MITLGCLVAVAMIVFLTVFILAKQKKIFINKRFVNESDSTIGVDVSAYQADMNMQKLKEQNIEFIYIKATEGSTIQDERFAENRQKAQKAELPCGAYHFFSFDSAGKTQAKNFINTMGSDLKG